MLTGRLPFEGPNTHETMMRIVQAEPVPPRQLRPRLSRDLETICLKCLEKEPARRYASAAELADDLGRFLAGEAVLARPPSAWRRSARWVRRRRVGVGVGVTVVLIAAMSLGGWQWDRYSRARDREVRANLHESLQQTLQQFDTDVCADGRISALQQGLQAKAALYEKLVRRPHPESVEREDLADIYLRLGWIEAFAGNKAEGEALIEKARSMFADLAAAGETACREKLANAWCDLGCVRILQGHPEQARAPFDEALRLHQQLAAESPGDGARAEDVACAWSALGGLLQFQGDLPGAEAAYHEACKQKGKAVAGPQALPRVGLQAGFLIRWGAVLDLLGRPEDADPAFDRALAALDGGFESGWSQFDVDLPDPQGAKEVLLPALRLPESSPKTLERVAYVVGVEALFQKMVDHYAARAAAAPGRADDRRRLARSHYYQTMAGFSREKTVLDVLGSARRGADLYDELLQNAPRDGTLALDAAQLSCHTAAFLLRKTNTNTQEARTWCDRGLALLDRAPLEGHQGHARTLRCNLLFTRAVTSVRGGQHVEALRDLEVALQGDPPPGAHQHVADLYAFVTVKAREYLVVQLVRQGRHAEAVAEADALAKLPHVPGEALYDGACACAVAAAAEKDPDLREKYAARAVERLRSAFATGFGKDPIQKASGIFGDPVQWMQRDADLVGLRDREDYRKLVADLTRAP